MEDRWLVPVRRVRRRGDPVNDPPDGTATVPTLEATIPTTGPSASPAVWQRAEAIAFAMRDFLQAQQRQASILAIREAPGALAFTVLATANEDPRRVHRLAAPVFAAAAPAGSQLGPIPLKLP
jgi:hypothetical protein